MHVNAGNDTGDDGGDHDDDDDDDDADSDEGHDEHCRDGSGCVDMMVVLMILILMKVDDDDSDEADSGDRHDGGDENGVFSQVQGSFVPPPLPPPWRCFA